MFSRRTFMKGATVAMGCLALPLSGAGARTATGVQIAIDSVETPLFTAAPGIRHLRLAGSQLERFETLRRLFSASPAMRVQAHLDDSGQVLLESALLATGISAGAIKLAAA
ncbi:MAG: twin-arginine translocation signal domain-containing protein [Pseudodonghicola sp.]